MNRIREEATLDISEDGELITVLLKRMSQIKCAFCSGEGHMASKCSSKRSMDQTARKLGLKASWGRIKGKLIGDCIQGAIQTRSERTVLKGRATELARTKRRQDVDLLIQAKRAIHQRTENMPNE